MKGINCNAYIMDNLIYKRYETNEQAEIAFNAQQEGYINDIAPKPIKLIDNVLVSEIADTSIQQILKPNVYYSDILIDIHNKTLKIFNKYGIRQNKKEWMRTDLVHHNLGLIDNKIVLIDWL